MVSDQVYFGEPPLLRIRVVSDRTTILDHSENCGRNKIIFCIILIKTKSASTRIIKLHFNNNYISRTVLRSFWVKSRPLQIGVTEVLNFCDSFDFKEKVIRSHAKSKLPHEVLENLVKKEEDFKKTRNCFKGSPSRNVFVINLKSFYGVNPNFFQGYQRITVAN